MKKKVTPRPQEVQNEDFPTIEEQEEMLEPERTLLKELLGIPEEKKPKPEVVQQPEPEEEYFFPHKEDREDYENLAKKVKENKEKKEKRFEPYQLGAKTQVIDDQTDHPVKEWLFEDADGPAKAIILSEVLKRKEF